MELGSVVCPRLGERNLESVEARCTWGRVCEAHRREHCDSQYEARMNSEDCYGRDVVVEVEGPRFMQGVHRVESVGDWILGARRRAGCVDQHDRGDGPPWCGCSVGVYPAGRNRSN